MSRRTLKCFAFVCFALVAIAVLAALDEQVARFVSSCGLGDFMKSHHILSGILKAPGEYEAVLVAGIIVLYFHPTKWRGALFLLAATAVSGVNGIVKWVVGRHRPFRYHGDSVPDLTPYDLEPFRGGVRGLFDGWNLGFPSGHVALAFALAAALATLWPRWRLSFFALATIVALQRVAENAHYVSDCAAAAALGIGGVWLVRWFVESAFPMALTGPTSNTAGAPGSATIDHTAGATDAIRVSQPVMREVSSDPSTQSLATMHPTSTQPYFSLVIPAYNEQENVPTLLTRVEAALNQIGKPFEVIIVDDGSTDSTPKLLSEAMSRLPWLRVLRMRKNGGQSAAFEAGFEAARGQVIATIDADLQNDPEEIPRLLPMLDDVDMVTGWRKDRQDTRFRRWQSRQANRLRNWITEETVNDSASSLKLYKANAIKGVKLFRGAHRYFPTLVKMRGYTVREEPVKHSPRFAGTAKYGFRNRAFVGLFDLFGVRWLKKRYLRYAFDEIARTGGEAKQ